MWISVGRLIGVVGAGSLVGAAPAAAAGPVISLHSSRGAARAGRVITLSGAVSGAPAGSAVRLYQSRYPYPRPGLIGTTITSAAGRFSFKVHLDRTTRYR